MAEQNEITDKLVEELKLYIKENYKLISFPAVFENLGKEKTPGLSEVGKGITPDKEIGGLSNILEGFVKEQRRPDFSHTLDSLRSEKGLKPAELYKAAWIDKRTYSKIMAPPEKGQHKYRPSKETVIQFAFALELDYAGFIDFLKNAGFALSSSSKRDLTIRFCAERGIFDLHDVNALLFTSGEKVLCKESKDNDD